MAKAILISIQPKWVKKILNGEKTLEIRKTMPKCDLPIDVYIYCTKGNGIKDFITMYKHDLSTDEIGGCYINGTIIAKFTLKEIRDVYAIHFPNGYHYRATDLTTDQLEQKSCLSQLDLDFYLRKHKGYAWCIEDLEIFDKPKELCEFATLTKSYKYHRVYNYLTCPPQSWCFVEI